MKEKTGITLYCGTNLKKHRGHHVSIVSYGGWDDPKNISLECEDCNEVILDAELYTICEREDI